MVSENATQLLARVRLLALDVDGTLTDGGVYYDDLGRESKRFHIQDGLGIVAAQRVGLQIAWITGRESSLVERRARELGVSWLRQGVRDKATALRVLSEESGVSPDAIAFMGDDWNDLPALQTAGVALAPANAVPEVRARVHWVTERAGGSGAVREAIEMILRAQGTYEAALAAYLDPS
ncbi:MAG: HAD-IIIA family hydrolase [Armatimonadaceae bacterium]